jgi:hypothetical protein
MNRERTRRRISRRALRSWLPEFSWRTLEKACMHSHAGDILRAPGPLLTDPPFWRDLPSPPSNAHHAAVSHACVSLLSEEAGGLPVGHGALDQAGRGVSHYRVASDADEPCARGNLQRRHRAAEERDARHLVRNLQRQNTCGSRFGKPRGSTRTADARKHKVCAHRTARHAARAGSPPPPRVPQQRKLVADFIRKLTTDSPARR